MIVEKLTLEELALYEVLRRPDWCGEFLERLAQPDDDPEPFEFTGYQKKFLLDFSSQVSWRAGRSVGKCLYKDSRILNTETGEYLTVKELSNRQQVVIPSLDESSMRRTQSEAYIKYNGKFPCLEIILSKGFRNITTFEHPFFTNHGWVEAQHLKIGDYVAIPNELPYFGTEAINDLDASMLAHFLAEGTYHNGSISTTEEEVIGEIMKFSDRHTLTVRQERCTYYISMVAGHKNYWLRLLEKYGLRNCHSYDKFIPKEFFSLNRETLSIILNRLFSDDGWAIKNEVGYATTSEKLARDIQHLLLRFGIVSSLGYKNNKHLGSWWLSIKGLSNLRKFKKDIGFLVQRKQNILEQIIVSLEDKFNQADVIPIPIYKKYRLKNKSETWTRRLRYFPTKNKQILNKDTEFIKWETADIYWLRVKSLKEVGEQDTYSIEAYPSHTLVADDIYSHNTVSLVHKITWHVINKFYDEILFTVPNRVHLDPVFLGLQRRFLTNKLLRNWVGKNSVNSQTFIIKFLNQFTLFCRIAGTTGTGANVIGLHVPVIILDETAYYPFSTWIELQPVLNDWQEGHQIVVAGVPDGRREKSVCYMCDTDEGYSHHRVSAYENPRFTREAEERALTQFGGKESQDFIRQVFGEHGTPTYAVFDRENMRLEDYHVPIVKIYGAQLKIDSQLLYRILTNLPKIPPHAQSFLFGMDLGYTQPTAIVGLFKSEEVWYFLFRLELYQVPFDVQEKFIDSLDTRYNPEFIGIDAGAGGQGKAIIDGLTNRPEYKDKEFGKRLVPVEFGGTVVVGHTDNGEELKERVKPFTVSKLQQMTNLHNIAYSIRDEDLITELCRVIYAKTPGGNVIYKVVTPGGSDRGDDHNFAALLTICMVLWQEFEERNYRKATPKLISSRWLK